MSQKSVLIALTIAIVLMMTLANAEAKRIGCASFGHSCYGGHGKRSDPAVQEVEAPIDQQPLSMMRVLQRRFPFQPEASANEIQDHEKEIKLLILGVLSDAVNDAIRRSTTSADQNVSS